MCSTKSHIYYDSCFLTKSRKLCPWHPSSAHIQIQMFLLTEELWDWFKSRKPQSKIGSLPADHFIICTPRLTFQWTKCNHVPQKIRTRDKAASGWPWRQLAQTSENLLFSSADAFQKHLRLVFYAHQLFFDRNPALFLEMELWLYLVFTVEEMCRFLHAAQAFVCLHNPRLGVKSGCFFSLAYFIGVNTVSRLLILCLSGIISTS